ncbi:helix-turn-helix domain-containing protein [Lacticaseibacillus pantheris]|uniref:helix-turn-helix domain-containing protein n=1 Tax=Lacticaseibacillus pantheris TaxID=171523 RepID=UPI00265B2E8D|nr:helix-turn-helix transcriptional regulator [Lacticaseibacillus pantheris]WKF84130.1 helix-turn-helix transcriptional regulator [Lacticaseibacillus pantheris]
MATTNFGYTYRELRRAKGYSLKAASGAEVSVQFLSQFERGESQISFERLDSLLRNIHVSLSEFVAAAGSDHLNWIDWWAYQLTEAWRLRPADIDAAVAMAPPSAQPAVMAINGIVLLDQEDQRGALTGTSLAAVTAVLRRAVRPGMFSNLVASLAAFALPQDLRIQTVTRLLEQPYVRSYARYLRPCTTAYAVVCLAEAEVVLGSATLAGEWLAKVDRQLRPADMYERLMVRKVQAGVAYAQGAVPQAERMRDQVLRAWQILDDKVEYQLFAEHIRAMFAMIGDDNHGTA